MILLLSILLFIITLVFGSIPLWSKKWNSNYLPYILAFSGAYLLSVTLTHLIPESLFHLGGNTAILIVIGFLLQLAIQRITHGIEHGHLHIHQSEHHQKISVLPLLIGMGIHAFSEGLPLGLKYFDTTTTINLTIAIIFHKLPELMLIATLLRTSYSKNLRWLLMVIFCLFTPVAALLTAYLGEVNKALYSIIEMCIPVVAGSFLHIATTIFYESGTKKHAMNTAKWIVILLGFGIGVATSMMGHHH